MNEATEYDEGAMDQALADAEELSRLEEEGQRILQALRSWQVKYESCRRCLILSSVSNIFFLWYIFWRFVFNG